MRPHDSLWQGCFGYWQNLFIRENLLPLGHTAWQGFTTEGRGIVVCDVAIVDPISVDWSSDVVEYTVRFIPEMQIPAYLQSLELEAAFVPCLMDTVRMYNPTQEILLFIQGDRRTDINLLQHLAISPADCYQQVQQRWAEFQFDQSSEDLYERSP